MLRAGRTGLLALALCALIPAAAAQSSACPAADARCEKLERLIEFLRYGDSIARLKKACADARKTFHPDVWVKTEPEAFFGLNPSSGEWPLVVQSFELYVQEACGDPPAAALLQKYRDAWNKRLSDAQLEAALAFFNTAGGAALSNGMTQAYNEFFEFYEPLASGSSYAAWMNYGQRVATIARRR